MRQACPLVIAGYLQIRNLEEEGPARTSNDISFTLALDIGRLPLHYLSCNRITCFSTHLDQHTDNKCRPESQLHPSRSVWLTDIPLNPPAPAYGNLIPFYPVPRVSNEHVQPVLRCDNLSGGVCPFPKATALDSTNPRAVKTIRVLIYCVWHSYFRIDFPPFQLLRYLLDDGTAAPIRD